MSMVYILISRDTKTGRLDARLFSSPKKRDHFRKVWEEELANGLDGNTGDFEFVEWHEAVRA